MAKKVASYDPNKKYNWGPDDSFILSGAEFGLVLNTLRAVLSTEEAARIMLAMRANDIVEGTLARAVEDGIAKEVPDNSQDANL